MNSSSSLSHRCRAAVPSRRGKPSNAPFRLVCKGSRPEGLKCEA
nr:MAG TPA: hypothetical protein [Caudoviricetes sp.]